MENLSIVKSPDRRGNVDQKFAQFRPRITTGKNSYVLSVSEQTICVTASSKRVASLSSAVRGHDSGGWSLLVV